MAHPNSFWAKKVEPAVERLVDRMDDRLVAAREQAGTLRQQVAELAHEQPSRIRADISSGLRNGVPHAVDDIRHKLIEEAWFGKTTTGDLTQADLPMMDVPHYGVYESVWGPEPTKQDLYGSGPAPFDPPSPDDLAGPPPEPSQGPSGPTPG